LLVNCTVVYIICNCLL